MTSPALALYLTCLLWGEMAFSSSIQESHFVSGKTGEELTLQCFFEGIVAARLYWYKQKLGEKPKLISSFYMYDQKTYFYGEFKNISRYTLNTENGNNHLTIADLHISDSATYFCMSCYLYTLDISVSTTVSVKGSGLNVPVLVHQSASETIQPGGSVTLNCTVHTGTCDGQHSVYWFKDSEESHPGLIYTHGGRNDQCERKPITQTHTCFYNLPMKNSEESHPGLIYTHGGRNDQCERKPSTQTHTCFYNLPMTLSDAGTYYCAVASCGRVLFGDGTKLDFEGESFFSSRVGFGIYWYSHSQYNTSNGEQNEENIHYAVVKGNKVNRSRRQRNNAETECIYSSIKQ
uniref:Ig-like domain-containing protein n=1 Tax=Cyclopterus lumpus TaxID=8103 RepID=A0A8C2ZDU0_CYCLU